MTIVRLRPDSGDGAYAAAAMTAIEASHAGDAGFCRRVHPPPPPTFPALNPTFLSLAPTSPRR